MSGLAEFFRSHILTIVCFWPLVGGVGVLFFRKEARRAVAWFATLWLLAGFLLSLPLWAWWWGTAPDSAGFRFVEKGVWIQAISVSYYMGIDGISLLLILLTTLLGVIACWSSWTAITDRVKEYYFFLLFLQTGMLGVFMALDLFLFYVFWEVMLVPMYFLIGIWGSKRRLYAAIKFFLYTLLGSVLMLLAIIYLYLQAGTFELPGILSHGLSAREQFWLFLAFFVGFAIKVPMFPFHTWLPDAHTEAPTAGSVILAGVLLKMGTYGFLRFSFPILPDATWRLLPWMLALSVIGIVYGAMVSLAQKDWKRLVAFSSVSHLGFVMLGCFALNVDGLRGGILQAVNHGISTGALFLIVGIVYERRHTRMIGDYGGLAKVMPVYAVVFAIVLFSSIGLPGLNGFIGEFTILVGAWQLPSKIWVCLAASGIVLGAAYMLWLYQRVMLGKVTREENRSLEDLRVVGWGRGAREFWYLVPLVLLALWIGLYPKPFFAVLEEPVTRLVQRLERVRTAQAAGGVPIRVAPGAIEGAVLLVPEGGGD